MANKKSKSKLFTAVRHVALDKEITQEEVSDNINRDNSWFWKQLDTKGVRFDHLEAACDFLDADIIIRSRTGQRLEYVVNPKEEQGE